ncbi:MAG: hypothetical protein ACOYVK_01645 [Bacillota bacterium]
MANVALNEILITVKNQTAFDALALRTDFYDIESTNTTEARIQSVSTDTGNEHTVQKLADESLITTNVPFGTFELIAASDQDKQGVRGLLARITLKAGLLKQRKS